MGAKASRNLRPGANLSARIRIDRIGKQAMKEAFVKELDLEKHELEPNEAAELSLDAIRKLLIEQTTEEILEEQAQQMKVSKE